MSKTTIMLVLLALAATSILPVPAAADDGGAHVEDGPCAGFSLDPLWVRVDPNCIVKEIWDEYGPPP